MQKIVYPQFNETLYRTVLPNGLMVNLLPRRGFHKTYSIFSANYGSIDTKYTDKLGRSREVPSGTAHFLEHKLFEKQDHDAFDIFGDYGADANAFTSFTKTSFLFSTTIHLNECLNTLLDFVQEPYFTSKTIEKEKGIIGEEISMYDDDPDWQLFAGLLRNLYPKDSLSMDIAGTKETIGKIHASTLYDCYHEFYQPSNMDLFVVGGFDFNSVLETIARNQGAKKFTAMHGSPKLTDFLDASGTAVSDYDEKRMDVTRPKSMIGIKGLSPLSTGIERLKYKLELELGLHLLFGESSTLFQRMFSQSIVDDSFSFELELERGFHFALITADTIHYEEMEEEVTKTINQSEEILASAPQQLDLAKREFLGQYIQVQNSLESVADSYEGKLFGHATLLDYATQIQKIDLASVIAAINKFFAPNVRTTFRILPINQ